jgi:hypothetical protein
VTNSKVEESLGRLSALKWFPTNAYALVAITEILKEVCPEDSDATNLIREVLATHNEWPGPLTLRTVHNAIVQRRRAAEEDVLLRKRRAEACAQRDVHESGCSGYSVDLNDDDHTVSVDFCNKIFGDDWTDRTECRKGDSLHEKDPDLCKRRLAEELASHPGWLTRDQFWALNHPRRK